MSNFTLAVTLTHPDFVADPPQTLRELLEEVALEVGQRRRIAMLEADADVIRDDSGAVVGGWVFAP